MFKANYFLFLADIPSLVAFEKNGLKVEFANSNPSPLNDFVFQATVPEVCILQWCEVRLLTNAKPVILGAGCCMSVDENLVNPQNPDHAIKT